jgi:hypothetical protein
MECLRASKWSGRRGTVRTTNAGRGVMIGLILGEDGKFAA